MADWLIALLFVLQLNNLKLKYKGAINFNHAKQYFNCPLKVSIGRDIYIYIGTHKMSAVFDTTRIFFLLQSFEVWRFHVEQWRQQIRGHVVGQA